MEGIKSTIVPLKEYASGSQPATAYAPRNAGWIGNADIARPALRVPWKQSPAFASTNYLAARTKEGKNAGVFPESSPSMWAFIFAIIAFGLSQVISILVAFRYGVSENQSLPPSTAAQKISTVGTLIAIAIAASDWLPEPLLALAPKFDAAHFLPFLALFSAALFAAFFALLQYLEKL